MKYLRIWSILLLAACSGGASHDTDDDQTGDGDTTDNDTSAEEWSKLYGETGSDVAADAVVTGDGTIIVVGYANRIGSNTDAWVLALDQQGNVLQDKLFGGLELDHAVRVVDIGNHTVAVAATTFSNDGSVGSHHGTNLYSDVWLFKFHYDTGAIDSGNVLGGDHTDYVTDMRVDSGGHVVVTGGTSSTNTGVFGANHSGGGGGELLADAWMATLDDNLQASGPLTLYGGTGPDVGAGWNDTTWLVNTASGKEQDLADVDVVGLEDIWTPTTPIHTRFGGAGIDHIVRARDGYYVGYTTSTAYGALGTSDKCIWYGPFGGPADMMTSARCIDGNSGTEQGNGVAVVGDTVIVVGKTNSGHTGDLASVEGDGWGLLVFEWPGGGKKLLLGGGVEESLEAVANAGDGYVIVVGTTTAKTGDFASNHGHEDAWVTRIKIPAH